MVTKPRIDQGPWLLSWTQLMSLRHLQEKKIAVPTSSHHARTLSLVRVSVSIGYCKATRAMASLPPTPGL